MPIRPFFRLFRQKQLSAMVAANALYKPFRKPSFLSVLKGSALMDDLLPGGNLGMEALSLWGASNAGGDQFPHVDEMAGQLHEAGFTNVDTMRLIPGDSFYAFCAM